MAGAKRPRAVRAKALPFNQTLVLNRWVLGLFGVETFDDLAKHLKGDSLEGLDNNNVSRMHNALAAQFHSLAELPAPALLEYDNNIVSHTLRINARRVSKAQAPIVWKHFQYLTLLFTEIYLDRYFTDSIALRSALNSQVERHNMARGDGGSITPLDEAGDAHTQLNKIAYWSATGSGKTLLMHVNIRQYQHYLTRVGRGDELNRTILLTPNEGLSRQHLGEFEASGITAELFDKNQSGMFAGSLVDIIDINKLADEMGDKTVAVAAFEGSNLVLVDEGHRGIGAAGKWLERRNALCENGFSFEYSATFGQAVKGSKPEAGTESLSDQYAKSILVDYSYRYFYGDGFGKDYQILNLEQQLDASHQQTYLVACLLTFFQQQRLYTQQTDEFRPFQIEKPLWVFVGGSVNSIRTERGRSVSDVVEILLFLAQFLANRTESIKTIDGVLRDGLVAANGKDLFAKRFQYLSSQTLTAAQIYDEVLAVLFNAPAGGALHVENLKGVTGEIAMRVGDHEPFGVINVGDDDKLCALCDEQPELVVESRDFASSLFHDLKKADSSVNLLIGSRKFTEGWSSWRVSTMGLMNIGKSEGSQIIQLFGRGVRLQGYGGSLKRSSTYGPILATPQHIDVLETLGVFGVHADYMATFRDFLIEEGLPPDGPAEVLLPVRTNLGTTPLRTLKLKETIGGRSTQFGDAFRTRGPVPTLTAPSKLNDELALRALQGKIVLNWYPKVQSQRSLGVATELDGAVRNRTCLTKPHVSLLNLDELFFDLELFKAQRGWHNLNITRQAIRDLLDETSWYQIEAPEHVFRFDTFDNVRRWQQIASALLRKYVERYYRYRKAEWELPHLEYREIDANDPNLVGAAETVADGYHYRVSVRSDDSATLVQLQELKRRILDGNRTVLGDWDHQGLVALGVPDHLYEPLLALQGNIAVIQPVPLDGSEGRFVRDLRTFAATKPTVLGGWELRFLRNRSKGSGVGFFEAGNFYPDFILWLTGHGVQHIVFIDPKGLRQVAVEHPKVEFYREIKQVEQRLADPSVRLHSFLVSNTPSHEMELLWPIDRAAMIAKNIVFQDEPDYVAQIIESVLSE